METATEQPAQTSDNPFRWRGRQIDGHCKCTQAIAGESPCSPVLFVFRTEETSAVSSRQDKEAMKLIFKQKELNKTGHQSSLDQKNEQAVLAF